MEARLERLLDLKPAWAGRVEERARRRIAADRELRRRAVAAVVVGWQAAELVLPRERVSEVRLLLLAMVLLDSVATYVWVSTGLAVEGNPIVAAAMSLYGDALGLVLRTIWSAALVLALAWLAERRILPRMALVVVVVPLGGVTLLHAVALAFVWAALLVR